MGLNRSERESRAGAMLASSGSFDSLPRKGATHSAQDDRVGGGGRVRTNTEVGGSIGESGDEGFLLLGAIVLVFMVLLVLSVAAPRMAKEIQREREVESEHRAQQYVRAIRVYYLKFKHYPGSIEQLEKTNNQRFLRQKYIDPLTGKDDWRMIHVGENQTKVKWMFGEELQGLQAGLGSASGLQSSINGFGSNSPGTQTPPNPGTQTPGTQTPGATSGTGTTGISSQSATDFKGGGGMIMGVGSAKTGESMVVVNEQTSYDTWEFLYDPRVEQYYQKANLFGGMGSGTGTSGFGSPVGTPIGGTAPTTPGGTSPFDTTPKK